jgi:hypothetical protein
MVGCGTGDGRVLAERRSEEAPRAHRHNIDIAAVERHNCAAVEASVHIALNRIADGEAQRHLGLLLIAPRGLEEGPGRDRRAALTKADLERCLVGSGRLVYATWHRDADTAHAIVVLKGCRFSTSSAQRAHRGLTLVTLSV